MGFNTISIIIPTLNSGNTLYGCLASILNQDYPRDKIEVLIVDGGSIDDTLKIVECFSKEGLLNIKVFNNSLRTAESGKAIGNKNSSSEILAFIDSDNILPESDWLKRMTQPFKDIEIIAAEPIRFTSRKEYSYITRYCALIGMNDPLCLFLGNYDRFSELTGRWTQVSLKEEDRGDYYEVIFDKLSIPTIGANGFLIRKQALDRFAKSDYIFDVDILYQLLNFDKMVKIAKVKLGIIHLFSSSIKIFARKQKRRIRDFIYYSKIGARRYPWRSFNKSKILLFVFYTITLFPLIAQSIKGFSRKPDFAWFFHPLACIITLWVYGWAVIRSFFVVTKLDRVNWRK